MSDNIDARLMASALRKAKNQADKKDESEDDVYYEADEDGNIIYYESRLREKKNKKKQQIKEVQKEAVKDVIKSSAKQAMKSAIKQFFVWLGGVIIAFLPEILTLLIIIIVLCAIYGATYGFLDMKLPDTLKDIGPEMTP